MFRYSVLLLPLVLLSASPGQARVLTFEYQTQLGPVDPGDGPVDIFIPLAVNGDQQFVLEEIIDSPVPGSVEREALYGNRYWHARVERGMAEPVTITISTTIWRKGAQQRVPQLVRSISDEERRRLALYLGANKKVPVGHAVLDPILAELRGAGGGDNPGLTSRKIYDWVVDNIQYKKVGSGWGNGDTFWACREGSGNCTDFHALFISLARTEQIPARFEIGFPVPIDRKVGAIEGYHCWVQFYLPGAGWIPVDASEAFKHPEKREFYYGNQGEDRIHFSTGRDIVLGSAQRSGSLNYFIYPHVEQNGRKFKGRVQTQFSYREHSEFELSQVRVGRTGP